MHVDVQLFASIRFGKNYNLSYCPVSLTLLGLKSEFGGIRDQSVLLSKGGVQGRFGIFPAEP